MIEILTVGGTIDKVYFDALSEFQIGDPAIEFVLGQAGVETEHTLRRLMSKDSLDMTDEDRATIRAAVAESEATQILITHGTDTMAKSAAVLDDAARAAGKTVVAISHDARFFHLADRRLHLDHGRLVPVDG